MMQRKIACFAPFGVVLAVGFAIASGPKLEYPQTLRVDHYDEYHGTRVADRLENCTSVVGD